MAQRTLVFDTSSPISQIGIFFNKIRIIFEDFARLQANYESLGSNISATVNDKDDSKLIKKLKFSAIFFEALLGVRAYTLILFMITGFQPTGWWFLVNFLFSFVICYFLIDSTIGGCYLLFKNRSYITETCGKNLGGFVIFITLLFLYVLIGLIPFINMTNTEDGEFYTYLSWATFLINIVIVTFIGILKTKKEYTVDMIGTHDKKEAIKKEIKDKIKDFQKNRGLIEAITPEFLKDYSALTPDEQNKINFPIEYLWILENEVFAGQNLGLIKGKINPADYIFISEWKNFINASKNF